MDITDPLRHMEAAIMQLPVAKADQIARNGDALEFAVIGLESTVLWCAARWHKARDAIEVCIGLSDVCGCCRCDGQSLSDEQLAEVNRCKDPKAPPLGKLRYTDGGLELYRIEFRAGSTSADSLSTILLGMIERARDLSVSLHDLLHRG